MIGIRVFWVYDAAEALYECFGRASGVSASHPEEYAFVQWFFEIERDWRYGWLVLRPTLIADGVIRSRPVLSLHCSPCVRRGVRCYDCGHLPLADAACLMNGSLCGAHHCGDDIERESENSDVFHRSERKRGFFFGFRRHDYFDSRRIVRRPVDKKRESCVTPFLTLLRKRSSVFGDRL